MRTWSLERVVVEVLGRAAVAAQGVLDALWPPNFPAQANDFPIPGCPDAGECRTHGCAGDCSEATEAGDDYQAVSPDGYYGYAEPDLDEIVTAECRRVRRDRNRARRAAEDPGCVFNTSPVASAGPGDSAEGVCEPPKPSPPSACTDPSRSSRVVPVRDEGPASAGHSACRGAGHLDLATWIEPAVLTILAAHRVDHDGEFYTCYDLHEDRPHASCADWQAWTEHITPNLCVHIVKALAAQQK